MGEMCVNFLDYDKVSDDLIFFSKDVMLRFNVSLARKGKDGNRYHYLNEYRYQSGYANYGNVVTVRRNFDYFLSIDVKGDFESSVIIKPKDILNLRDKIKSVGRWFTNKVFSMDKNGHIFITKEVKPIFVTNLSGKYIKFEPSVATYPNGDTVAGVRITLNDSKYFDISVETFMEFTYLINSIDMYGAALTIVNSIPAIMGQNVRNMGGDGNISGGSGKGSFFDSK